MLVCLGFQLWAQSSAVSSRWCPQSRTKPTGLQCCTWGGHWVWQRCSCQLLDAAESWEKREKDLRVSSEVEGASASVLRALVSQVFLFYSPLKMQRADTWKWDVRSQNILLGLGFPFHVLYWYCKQISHSWDNNNDHELHLELWIYPNGNPQSYLIPEFTFSVSSLSTWRRWLNSNASNNLPAKSVERHLVQSLFGHAQPGKHLRFGFFSPSSFF